MERKIDGVRMVWYGSMIAGGGAFFFFQGLGVGITGKG